MDSVVVGLVLPQRILSKSSSKYHSSFTPNLDYFSLSHDKALISTSLSNNFCSVDAECIVEGRQYQGRY